MKFTIVQTDIKWEDISANISHVQNLLNDIEQSDVIVLPEMWTTGFTMNTQQNAENMNGSAVRQMKAWAKEKDALIIGSLIITENGQYFNRLIAAHPDGQMDTYDKRHLFSFAGEDKHYAPGQDVKTINFRDWTFLPQICYDVRFPVYSRYRRDLAYDAIIYVANFPNKRIDAWNQLLKARAIENECFVVAVNRTGMDGLDNYYSGGSQIIDYSGQSIVYLNAGEKTKTIKLKKTDLQKFRKAFPFLKDRDIQ